MTRKLLSGLCAAVALSSCFLPELTKVDGAGGGDAANMSGSQSGGTKANGGGKTGGGSTATGEGGDVGANNSGGSAAGGGNDAGGTDSGVSGKSGSAGNGGASSAGTANGGGTSAGSGGTAPALDNFSFFVTSLKAMRQLSGSQDGFGGDLRYGTADGLTGADKICTEIAEASMTGASKKVWKAFLSTSKVNAKDRIGAGPWYDRTGRLVAQSMANLLSDRPKGADPAIINDLPNEDGVPNHRPNVSLPEEDNHHVLTGTGPTGTLYAATGTCLDWTSSLTNNATTGRPRTGFSWSISNRIHWFSAQDEGGCGAGVSIVENGGPNPGNPIVGSGGGYGAIYCFALQP